jgi:hypothetical protein
MHDGYQPGVVLRLAGPVDTQRLETLAQLDSAPAPTGRVLMAELDGRLEAAISLDDDHVIANPFHRTGDLVALLRVRAGQPTARGTSPATTLSALERRFARLRSAKPFAALRRLA